MFKQQPMIPAPTSTFDLLFSFGEALHAKAFHVSSSAFYYYSPFNTCLHKTLLGMPDILR